MFSSHRHADLLHFIAQKESKCLELRSQLVAHESELLQLKQKWERIVHHEFGRTVGTYSPAPPQITAQGAASMTAASAGSGMAHASNGAVLDGIVEGVQGVGRLLAAGLSTAGTIPVSPSPSSSSSASAHARTPSLAARPSPFAKRGSGHGGHAAHGSMSSTSTSAYATTSSTRLSQSSSSSLGEDAVPPRSAVAPKAADGVDDGVQELIVRDTGATPTMSPNPAFLRRHPPPPLHPSHSQPASPASRPNLDSTTTSSRILRRRSREVPLVPLDSDNDDDAAAGAGADTKRALQCQDSASVKQTQARKRMSGGRLPPASSMPGAGLGSGLAWVGTVGKKIEELQVGQTCVVFLPSPFSLFVSVVCGWLMSRIWEQHLEESKTRFLAARGRLAVVPRRPVLAHNTHRASCIPCACDSAASAPFTVRVSLRR